MGEAGPPLFGCALPPPPLPFHWSAQSWTAPPFKEGQGRGGGGEETTSSHSIPARLPPLLPLASADESVASAQVRFLIWALGICLRDREKILIWQDRAGGRVALVR